MRSAAVIVPDPPVAAWMLPTATLLEFDCAAVNDAPHEVETPDAGDAGRLAAALELIDVLDALGAESLNVGAVDDEILSLLVDADLTTSTSFLMVALAAAMEIV